MLKFKLDAAAGDGSQGGGGAPQGGAAAPAAPNVADAPPVVVQELPPHKALHNLELATALWGAGWRGSGTLARPLPPNVQRPSAPAKSWVNAQKMIGAERSVIP